MLVLARPGRPDVLPFRPRFVSAFAAFKLERLTNEAKPAMPLEELGAAFITVDKSLVLMRSGEEIRGFLEGAVWFRTTPSDSSSDVGGLGLAGRFPFPFLFEDRRDIGSR